MPEWRAVRVGVRPADDQITNEGRRNPGAFQAAGLKPPKPTQAQQDLQQRGENLWMPSEGMMGIYPVGSDQRLVVPFAPREVTYTGFGRTWAEVARDGDRTPLLIKAGPKIKTMQFQLMIGDSGWSNSQASILSVLEDLANSEAPLVVVYSSMESGIWRIDDMTIQSLLRVENTNEIARATVDITFKRAGDAVQGSGPVTGGVGSDKPKRNQNYTSQSVNVKPDIYTGPRTYKVQKGDTLQSIAIKFFKDASEWRYLADLNKIDNLKKADALKVGQILKLV